MIPTLRQKEGERDMAYSNGVLNARYVHGLERRHSGRRNDRRETHLNIRLSGMVMSPAASSPAIDTYALDYEALSPAFAQVLRRQLPRLQPIASYLGEIRTIEFQGVGGQGWDVYDVHRERGSGRWRIALGSDGKILGALGTLTSPVTLGP